MPKSVFGSGLPSITHSALKILCRQCSESVDHPFGIEDLVPAVLRVRLREHHELDVARIASHPGEVFEEVLNLVVGKREAHLAVRALELSYTARKQIDSRKRLRLEMPEEPLYVVERAEDRFGHAIVQVRRECALGVGTQRRIIRLRDPVGDAPLDALQHLEAAMVRDVGCLGRPWRNRAYARNDEKECSFFGSKLARRAVLEQALEPRLLRCIERPSGMHEVPELRCYTDLAHGGRHETMQFLKPERREGGAAPELDQLQIRSAEWASLEAESLKRYFSSLTTD
jgi:hypothetical protein